MINLTKLSEIEKAKILLNPQESEILRVNKTYNIFIRSMTTSINMGNGHSLDIDLSFTVMRNSEVPKLDPNKQYIIAEVE